jgi:hypothetical protein
MAEPWNTVLFLVVIPLVQQGLKLLADKYGYTLNKLANQALSLVLAGVFLFLSGGFAGVEFPAWEGDLTAFVGALIGFLGVAWSSLMALYELIWDRLFTAVRLATKDKY